MATTAKRTTKKKAELPIDGTPSQMLAAKILAARNDLTPSVRRIVESELGEEGVLRALTLFEGSLPTPSDPMRHPANAIEAARAELSA